MYENRVAVISGASAGIGRATTTLLLSEGWHVIGLGRDPKRCDETEAAMAALTSQGGGRFELIRADLSSMAETALAANTICALTDTVDVLINNAGGVRSERILTEEGNEATFAANHLAAFLLTKKLLPILHATAHERGPVRVLGVSSSAHEYCQAINFDDLTFERGFSSTGAYMHAKLANILFARELARRNGDLRLVSHVMHPGLVDSNFASHAEPAMKAHMEANKDRAISPEAAADTLVWLATDPEPAALNGKYFHQRTAVAPSAAALDDAVAMRLWDVTDALVAHY